MFGLEKKLRFPFYETPLLLAQNSLLPKLLVTKYVGFPPTRGNSQ